MTATVAQLGARALRKLGVAIVANASRPAAGATVTAATVAARVLLELGVPVPEGDRPAAPGAALGVFVLGVDALNEQPIVAQSEIAARALRAVGINPAPIGVGTATGITYNADQLAVAVLIKLTVIASDETPSAADRTEATARVYAAHDILAGADYVTWTVNTVPADVADFYIIMAAQLTAPQFGKPASMETFTAAQAMVRQQALTGAYGQSLAMDKVVEVHERLNAAGLVRWDVASVPAAQAEAYVQMTAALLAPVYGYQQDAQSVAATRAAADAAEASVRRAAVIAGAQERAAEKVIAVQNEVNALGLVTWTANAIPAGMVDPIATLAVMQMGPEFGKEFDPKMWEFNLNRIRQVSMGGPAGQALAEQKIRAVQWSLEARGRARWSLFDIPSWAEEPLVLMAATLLAPEVGVKADPNWAPAAEMDLMRIVSLPSNREPVPVSYF
jgi:hypothetical protein